MAVAAVTGAGAGVRVTTEVEGVREEEEEEVLLGVMEVAVEIGGAGVEAGVEVARSGEAGAGRRRAWMLRSGSIGLCLCLLHRVENDTSTVPV